MNLSTRKPEAVQGGTPPDFPFTYRRQMLQEMSGCPQLSCEPLRTVIFDGECGFCLRAIQLGKRLDWGHRMEWRARLEPGLLEQFPQLSHEGTQRRIVSIRPDGTTYGGFFAVRDIMRHLPLTALPALLLFLPGVSWVGVPLYQWVASHRYRFSGTGDDHCPVRRGGHEGG